MTQPATPADAARAVLLLDACADVLRDDAADQDTDNTATLCLLEILTATAEVLAGRPDQANVRMGRLTAAVLAMATALAADLDDADEICGDCVEGRCHWGGDRSQASVAAADAGADYVHPRYGRCGCARHAASVAVRILRQRAEAAGTAEPSPPAQPPDPMPVFAIKAKDALSCEAVRAYHGLCVAQGLYGQAAEVEKAIAEILAWQHLHPHLVKLPDHTHVPVGQAR